MRFSICGEPCIELDGRHENSVAARLSMLRTNSERIHYSIDLPESKRGANLP